MFEKLKQNLPEPLKKLLGDNSANEEDNSEEEDADSHDTETKEASGSKEDPKEDPKKKQISMIIRVVVILGLAYLFVDQIFLTETPTDVPAVAAKPRRKRKKDLPKTGQVVEASKTATDLPNPGVADNKPAETQLEEKKPEEIKPEEIKKEEPAALPPVENINIAEKKAEPETPVAPQPEVQPEVKPEVAPEVTQAPQPIDNTPVVNPNIGEKEDKLDKMIDGLENNAGKSKLEDKIVQEEAAYTPPPAYDKVGRGLVYNCKDKYWACIDKASYIACNKNMKWNKSHGKAVECSVQNVYNNDDDCGTVQKYNVSTNKATDFCN